MKPIKLQTINEKFKVGTDEYEKLYEDDIMKKVIIDDFILYIVL